MSHEPSIRIEEHGPYHLRGAPLVRTFEVISDEGDAVAWAPDEPIDTEGVEEVELCRCGRSSTKPFCDGTHKAFGLAPLEYTATATTQVWFCGCKSTKSKPMCDGTHKTI